MGTVQEVERFRYLNDEIYQVDIDNYYSKYLDIYRKNLLQTTQKWNKCKNKVSKNKNEIEELKTILKNPKELKKKKFLEEQKNSNDSKENNTTEGDNEIFLLVFDEFEDDYEPALNEQDLILYEDTNVSNNNNNEIKKVCAPIRRVQTSRPSMRSSMPSGLCSRMRAVWSAALRQE